MAEPTPLDESGQTECNMDTPCEDCLKSGAYGPDSSLWRHAGGVYFFSDGHGTNAAVTETEARYSMEAHAALIDDASTLDRARYLADTRIASLRIFNEVRARLTDPIDSPSPLIERTRKE